MSGKKSNLFSRNQLREIDEFAKNNGYLDATEYLLEAHNNYKKTVNTSKPFIRDANTNGTAINFNKLMKMVPKGFIQSIVMSSI